MMQGIYSVRDDKVGFLQLMQDTNDATALRNFEFAVTKPDSLYVANKADFRLFKLGTFDTLTGEIVLEPTPTLLATGDSFI